MERVNALKILTIMTVVVVLCGCTDGTTLRAAVEAAHTYQGALEWDVASLPGGGTALPCALALYSPESLEAQYAYVADGWSVVHVIDVGTKTAPKEIGTLSGVTEAFGLCIFNNELFVSADNGLFIYSLVSPENPSLEGSFAGPHGDAVSYTGGNYCFMVSNTQVLSIDISNRATPIQAGSCTIPLFYYGCALDNNQDFLYVGGMTGLSTIDVSTPTSPHLVDTYATPAAVTGVGLGMNLVAGCGDAGLVVLSPATALEAPQLRGNLNRTIGSLSRFGDAGCSYRDVFLLSYADPANPTSGFDMDIGIWSVQPRRVEHYGTFIYVAYGISSGSTAASSKGGIGIYNYGSF